MLPGIERACIPPEGKVIFAVIEAVEEVVKEAAKVEKHGVSFAL